MILLAIVVCEVAFWVVLGAGLVLRYPLGRPRAGMAVLAMVPVVDVVLLIVTALSLRSGATAGASHALAAFYIGFSLAYGRRMVRWADLRFARRFAGGSRPARPAGAAYTRQCWGDVLRTAGAAACASLIVWVLVAWVGEPVRTVALEAAYRWAVILVGAEVLWALSYTVWPRRGGSNTQTDATVGDRQAASCVNT